MTVTLILPPLLSSLPIIIPRQNISTADSHTLYPLQLGMCTTTFTIRAPLNLEKITIAELLTNRPQSIKSTPRYDALG